MSGQNPKRDEEERIRSGQSAARGATGDGQTAVPAGEQGISNRAGDAEAADDHDDDDDVDDGTEGPLMDPEAEPGKPI